MNFSNPCHRLASGLPGVFYAAGAALLLLSSCRKSPAPEAAETNFKVYSFATGQSGFDAVKLSNNTFVAMLQQTAEGDTARQGSLLCVDAGGNQLWNALLPEGYLFSGIAATGDGGLAVVGYQPGFASLQLSYWSYDMEISSTVYVAHYTAEGYNDWNYTLQRPQAVFSAAICSGADGGSIEVAACWGAGQERAPYRIHLIRLSLNGSLNSIQELHLPGEDDTDTAYCYAPQKIHAVENGLIITGGTSQYPPALFPLPSSAPAYFTLKSDESGHLLWFSRDKVWREAITSPEEGLAYGVDICTGEDNTILVAKDSMDLTSEILGLYPSYRGNYFFQPYGMAALDIFDAGTGSLKRTITYPRGTGLPYISRTTDHHYIIAGTNNQLGNPSHIFLIKADKNMDPAWQQQLNIPYPARAFGALETDEGGYLIFANVQTFGGNEMDIAVIKTDANGGLAMEH